MDQVIEANSSPVQNRNKPRSLPKTERKQRLDFSVDYKTNSYQKVNYLDSSISYNIPQTEKNDVFNKTLSYFATARKRKGGAR